MLTETITVGIVITDSLHLYVFQIECELEQTRKQAQDYLQDKEVSVHKSII